VAGYHQVFGHYASRTLGDDDLFRLTERGRELIQGRRPLPSHHNHRWRYLDLDVVDRLLAGLAHADAKGQPLSIGRIVAVLTKRERDPERARPRVLRQLLWLLKYGFVEQSPGVGAGPSETP
jgi:hypothetical protein